LMIIGQVQEALGWCVEALTKAGNCSYADDATCARWLQHTTQVICSTGRLSCTLVGALWMPAVQALRPCCVLLFVTLVRSPATWQVMVYMLHAFMHRRLS
jgi:hypothetical protein